MASSFNRLLYLCKVPRKICPVFIWKHHYSMYLNTKTYSTCYRRTLQTVFKHSSPLQNAFVMCYSTEPEVNNERPKVQSTVDEEELENFRKLSHLWWNELGEFQALHTMNDLRVPWIKETLVQNRETTAESVCQPLQGLTVLDAGCGGGLLSEPLARLGAFVIGIDMVEENIGVAQAHLKEDPYIAGKLKYIQSSIEDLVLTEEETFDAVVASEVVEHVSDLETFINCCSRLLKPGGSLFITTINKTLLSKALAIYGAENLLRLVPAGTHDWEKFVEPDVLKYEMKQNDLSTRLIHGMCYNPVTSNWSWIKDTSINYAVHAVKTVDNETSSYENVINMPENADEYNATDEGHETQRQETSSNQESKDK